MFTGAAYALPELPTQLHHQFMELGYHVYVMSTQAFDVEATKPALYSTVMVLLMLTFLLNFTADHDPGSHSEEAARWTLIWNSFTMHEHRTLHLFAGIATTGRIACGAILASEILKGITLHARVARSYRSLVRRAPAKPPSCVV